MQTLSTQTEDYGLVPSTSRDIEVDIVNGTQLWFIHKADPLSMYLMII